MERTGRRTKKGIVGPLQPRSNNAAITSGVTDRKLCQLVAHHVGGSCEPHIAHDLEVCDMVSSNELTHFLHHPCCCWQLNRGIRIRGTLWPPHRGSRPVFPLSEISGVGLIGRQEPLHHTWHSEIRRGIYNGPL